VTDHLVMDVYVDVFMCTLYCCQPHARSVLKEDACQVGHESCAHRVNVCWCRYGRDHPVKHIKLQRDADGSFYIADCKMFRNIVVSTLQ